MNTLYIYDCVDGKLLTVHNLPALIGNTPRSTCQINMTGDAGVIMGTGATGCSFFPQVSEDSPIEINGEALMSAYSIPLNQETLISVGGGLFIAYWSSNPADAEALFKAYSPRNWFLHDNNTNKWYGPYPLEKFASDPTLSQVDTWVIMAGMREGYCRSSVIQKIAYMQTSRAVVSPANLAQPESSAFTQANDHPFSMQEIEETAAIYDDKPDEDTGQYTCPVCWLKFDIGDVMNIASHPDLMGDPVLGRDKMLRFLATRFNAKGQALDSTGTPCTDIACPHCRSKLPPHFLDSHSHIFSIIGAPSAGKSYYLASLIHEMENTIPCNFPFAWRDSDPTGNSMLNEVSYRLFNAPTAETAYLSKTDLEGVLYSEFYRHGRMVKLPKPFVYDIYHMTDADLQTSLIFYDNAGEHFEPGRNSEDSPGARHVAVADGLFFLFDPTSSPAFRRMIGEHTDPQLDAGAPMRMDQQNIIMAETSTRISSILNLNTKQRIDVPMAIMIGKSDLWMNKLGAELQPVMKDGKVDQAAVDANSLILRAFLMKMHPSLCTTAETLSSRVRYFAISPLGCSPVTFYDAASGSMKIGPDPSKLAPQHVCDPTLWVLSIIEPQLIPSL